MLRYIFILSLLVFLGLAGLVFWASSPNHGLQDYNTLITKEFESEALDDSLLQVVTYNIGFLSGMTNNRVVDTDKSLYEQNLRTVLSKLADINPDIICLQEVDYNSDRSFHVDQHEAIQELGYGYAGKAVNWDEKHLPFPGSPFDFSSHYGSVFSGQSIVSKFPLSDIKRIVLERSKQLPFHVGPFYIERLMQRSTVNVNGRNIQLMNVHLDAFDPMARTKQITFIKEYVEDIIDEGPMLLVGDFNDDIELDSSCLSVLTSIPDLAVAETGEVLESRTFPSDDPKERLDYIFYNRAFIEMLDASVLHEFGTSSDHLPVLMSFRLKETKGQ